MMRSFPHCPLNKYSLAEMLWNRQPYLCYGKTMLSNAGNNSKPFLVTSDLKRSSGLWLNDQYPHCMHNCGSTYMTSTDTQKLPWLSLLHTLPLHRRADNYNPCERRGLSWNVSKDVKREERGFGGQAYSIQHHPPLVFSTPPPGSRLFLELGP